MPYDRFKIELPLLRGSVRPTFAVIQLYDHFRGFTLAELKRAADRPVDELEG